MKPYKQEVRPLHDNYYVSVHISDVLLDSIVVVLIALVTPITWLWSEVGFRGCLGVSWKLFRLEIIHCCTFSLKTFLNFLLTRDFLAPSYSFLIHFPNKFFFVYSAKCNLNWIYEVATLKTSFYPPKWRHTCEREYCSHLLDRNQNWMV